MSKGPGQEAFSLLGEYAEGFQLLHMLRHGYEPCDRERLITQVTSIVDSARMRGLAAGMDPATVNDAGYAFCAAIDEAVLASACEFRLKWESEPLQLSMFGDQLAGHHFFDRLARLRERGKAQVAALEVFHMCLLLGFRGRYLLDSDDKLRFLVTRLAEEISHARGGPMALAPQGMRPDWLTFPLPPAISAGAIAATFSVLALLSWSALYLWLDRQATAALAGHADLVQMPARVAHVSITLP